MEYIWAKDYIIDICHGKMKLMFASNKMNLEVQALLIVKEDMEMY